MFIIQEQINSKGVTGSGTQFEYDGNGNLKNDYLAGNLNIKYDHRNLMTQVTKVLTQFPPSNQVTLYRYDEEGNRTRKVIYNTSDPDPEFPVGELDKPPSGWDLIRDVERSEIPIYREVIQSEERTDLNLQCIILMIWSIIMSGQEVKMLR